MIIILNNTSLLQNGLPEFCVAPPTNLPGFFFFASALCTMPLGPPHLTLRYIFASLVSRDAVGGSGRCHWNPAASEQLSSALQLASALHPSGMLENKLNEGIRLMVFLCLVLNWRLNSVPSTALECGQGISGS